jgi:hypothetical protein
MNENHFPLIQFKEMNPTLGSAPFFHASGPTAFLLGDAEE